MPKLVSPKARKPIIAIVAGTAIALGLGTYLGARLANRSVRFVGQAAPPAGIEVVPTESVLVLTVSTDTNQWRQLRQLGTPDSRAQLDQQLVQWRDRLLASQNLDYATDIQPWLGAEITLAFLPLMETPNSIPAPSSEAPDATDNEDSDSFIAEPDGTDDPEAPELPAIPDEFFDPQRPLPLVAVLPIADAAAAQESFARQTAEQPGQTQDYQGFEIRELGQGESALALTVVNNEYVLLSRDSANLERVLDAYQDGAVLSGVEAYREAIAEISTGQPFLRLYLNGDNARQVVADNTLQPSPVVALSPLQRNQGMAASLTLESDGVRVQGVNWLPEASEVRYTRTNRAGTVPALLPNRTPLLLATDNLVPFWDLYRQNSTLNPANPFNPNTFEQGLNSLTGLSLTEDLLTWMDGEFAGGLVTQAQPGAEPQTGVVLLAETSDRTTAEASFAKLDAVMGDRYRFQVSEAQIDGTPITTWTSPFGSLTLTHGWLTNDTAFLAIGANTVDQLLPTPQDTLADNPGFQATQSDTLNAHSGRFFLDLDELRQLGGAVPLPTLPDRSGAYLGAIRQIGLTTAIRGDRSTRFDLHLRLYQDGDVPPLPSN